jgi:hypothetical protein
MIISSEAIHSASRTGENLEVNLFLTNYNPSSDDVRNQSTLRILCALSNELNIVCNQWGYVFVQIIVG